MCIFLAIICDLIDKNWSTFVFEAKCQWLLDRQTNEQVHALNGHLPDRFDLEVSDIIFDSKFTGITQLNACCSTTCKTFTALNTDTRN